MWGERNVRSWVQLVTWLFDGAESACHRHVNRFKLSSSAWCAQVLYKYPLALLMCAFMARATLSAQSHGADAADSAVRTATEIVLIDDREIVGAVTRADSVGVIITMKSGATAFVRHDEIASVRLVEIDSDGKRIRRLDPNRTHLLIAPTGRPMKRGEAKAALREGILATFGIGVTDYLSITAGALFVVGPLFVQVNATAFASEHATVSAGAVVLSPPNGDGSAMAIAYGVGTFGDDLTSVSLGVGYAYDDAWQIQEPVLMFGGEVQFTENFKVITENYYVPGTDIAILSAAMRFFDDNVAGDLGAFLPAPGSSMIPLPWVAITYRFGLW